MSRVYAIWGLDTGNMVGDWDTEADALAYVREMIAAYGPEAVSQWALGWEDDEGDDDGGPIVWGHELIEKARAEAP